MRTASPVGTSSANCSWKSARDAQVGRAVAPVHRPHRVTQRALEKRSASALALSPVSGANAAM
jgi:hypothetical protein